IDALCAALAARGLAPAPLVVPSLKDEAAAEFLRRALARLDPAVIVTTTAFAAGNAAEPTPLDGPDVPVLQVVVANTKRSAWCASRAQNARTGALPFLCRTTPARPGALVMRWASTYPKASSHCSPT